MISGLARGVDGEAHRGCVEAGGVGVAVLACGIDVDYPSTPTWPGPCWRRGAPSSPNTRPELPRKRGGFLPEVIGTYMRILGPAWKASIHRPTGACHTSGNHPSQPGGTLAILPMTVVLILPPGL